jgi:hypothetical protein
MVKAGGSTGDVSAEAGLCGDCEHARRVASDRGSVFVLCGLSATDSRFAKYPRLPVLSCPGYRQKREAANNLKS